MDSRAERRIAEDRISSLPDVLLSHILSFLEMRQVVATSRLSSRWRWLWTSAPTLKFGYEPCWSPRTISRALHHYERAAIRTLCIHSEHPIAAHSASHADSWILFAVQHGVREFRLCFSADDEDYVPGDLYKLHHSLFTCGSIEILQLKLCELNLPSSVHLQFLKTLELCLLEITDVEILVLTSGCPLLENLALLDCNPLTELNIFVPNKNLKRLRVHFRTFEVVDGVRISAPHVFSLEMGGAFRSYYTIHNLSSIFSANLDFEEEQRSSYCEETMIYEFVDLLSSLSQAKSLKLCGWCVKVLSIVELLNLSSPHFQATYLELKMSYTKWDRPGITYLLRNFHFLESLTLNINDLTGDYELEWGDYHPDLGEDAFDERDYWSLLDRTLPFQSSQLETVKIYGFMGSKYSNPEERESMDIEKFIQRREHELELVRFFLKYFKALDKIIINITDDKSLIKCFVKSELLLGLAQRLQILPKISPKTKIIFT